MMTTQIESKLATGCHAVIRSAELTGVFATLATQHGEVAKLIERARIGDAELSAVWPTLRRTVLSHEQGEVREVYPALHACEPLRPLADHHDQDASELESMIRRIDGERDAPSRRAQFEQLAKRVLHHAREEEEDIFPQAQAELGKARAEALARPFLEAQRAFADAAW
jgi:hypothetical protein